jgi:hypothetical protein
MSISTPEVLFVEKLLTISTVAVSNELRARFVYRAEAAAFI